jgi:hypothetical protein
MLQRNFNNKFSGGIMKKFLLAVFFFFSISYLQSEPLIPYAKNVLSANGSNDIIGLSVCIDSESNVYYTGTFEGTADFGDDQFTSSGKKDLFIAKTDSSGNFIWVIKASGVSDIIPKQIIADDNDNIYITGNYTGSADFGDENINSEGAQDAFLAKYDTDGNCIWVVSAGSRNADYGHNMATDNEGNIVLIGIFQKTIDFGNSISLTATAFQETFVSMYDSDGVCQWASQIEGDIFDFSSGNSVEISGNSIVVSGNYAGLADFGNSIELNAESNLDVFIAEYNKDGVCQWAKRIGGSDFSDFTYAYDMVSDDNSNIYIAGFFQGNIEIDESTTYTSNGNEDIFLLKYDSSGDFIWGNTYGSTGYDAALSIALGDYIYLAGSFSNSVEFDAETTLSSNGGDDVFIALFDFEGLFYGAYSAGSTQKDIIYDIVSDENNLGYITGGYSDEIVFGDALTLYNQGDYDAFFTKMNFLPVIIRTIDYNLSEGWNYISANVIPDDTEITSVFNAITDDIVIVTDNNSNIYIPSVNLNTIGDLQPEKVFSVYANTETTFSITGELVKPEDYTFSLDAGWNFIPYLMDSQIAPATAFNSIVDKIVIVTDNQGNFFIPDLFDTIENLKAGKGYKIYLREPTDFTYPNN